MNRKASSSVAFAGVMLMCLLALPSRAQDDPSGQEQTSITQHTLTFPLEGETPEQAYQDGLAGNSLPTWPYQVTSRLNNGRYTAMVVGNAPGQPGDDARGTTNIPLRIIPLIINFRLPNGTIKQTFDPTQQDNCLHPAQSPLNLVQQSPLLQNSGPYMWGNPAVNVGIEQYTDAQLRGEFWNLTQQNPNWHTTFKVRTLAAITLNVPPLYWWFPAGQKCSAVGEIYLPWIDSAVRSQIRSLTQQGLVGPTVVPLFITKNVYSTTGPGSDIGGYHNAYGSPMQTYAISAIDSSGGFFPWSQDINILSHELGELINDPMGTNYTPLWGHIGQQPVCQNNFEVGDPLTGLNLPVINLNGFPYHVQELGFASWFYRPAANQGVPGWYSSNGSLVGDAGSVCNRTLPPIVMSPSNGPAGTRGTITINRFPPLTRVTVTINNQPWGILITNRLGSATGPFTIPQNAMNGLNLVRANVGNYYGYFWFVVPN